MKTRLALIALFGLIGLSTLHRGGISFQTHLLWTIALLPIFILSYRGAIRHKQSAQRYFPTPLLGLIMLFGLSIMTGWLMSTMRDFGFISITTLLSGIATLLVVTHLDVTQSDIRKLLSALCILAAGLSTFGIILYLGTPIDRLAGSFAQLPYLVTSYPNAFALFLITLLPYALFQFAGAFYETHTRNEKITWFTITALMFASLLLTFSRGGMIVAGLMIIHLLFTKKLRLTKPFILLCVVTIVLITAAQLIRSQRFEVNQFAQKIALQSDEKTSSVDERISFWKGSISLIKERPVLGFGPDTFGYAFPHYQTAPLATSNHPHNMFLKHAVEFGVPSALLFLVLIAAILGIGYRHVRNQKNDELTIILIISAIGVVAHNMIDYNLNFTANSVLFWMTLGLILNRALSQKQWHESLITPRRVLISITALAVTIVFVGGGYEIYQRQKIVRARSLTADKQYQEAENTFSTTHPIFFEDAVILRANNAIEMKNYPLAIQLLVHIITNNRIYAEANNTLAEVLLKNGDLKNALEVNQEALRLDKYNRLKYHADLLAIIQKMNLSIDEKLQKGYETMMHTYLELLMKNSHHTITTDNPSSAIKIAYQLEAMATTPLRKLKAKNVRNKLIEAAQQEQKKFFDLYYIPVPPL